jgi:hypothetical protein
MEEFTSATKETFPPTSPVQCEDFSTHNAFKYLNLFRRRYKIFNDDIRRLLALRSMPLLIVYYLGFRALEAAVLLGFILCRLWPVVQRSQNPLLWCWQSGIGVAKQPLTFQRTQPRGSQEAHICETNTTKLVYAHLDRIRHISSKIALTVIKKTQEQVCAEISVKCKSFEARLTSITRKLNDTTGLRHLEDYIHAKMWNPLSESSNQPNHSM